MEFTQKRNGLVCQNKNKPYIWGVAKMSDIRLPLLSIMAAELAIVDLWLRVVRYDLRTPELRMKMHRNDRIDLTLRTKDEMTMLECGAWSRLHRQTVSQIPGRSPQRPLEALSRPAPWASQKGYSGFPGPVGRRRCFIGERRRGVVRARSKH
jgi:hypothetical protein